MKLVEVKTQSAEDQQFIVTMLEKALVEAKEGRVRQMAIIWEDPDGVGHSFKCGKSRWSMIGLMERAKLDMLITEAE